MSILTRALPGVLAVAALVVPTAAHAAPAKPVSLKTTYDCATSVSSDRAAVTVRTRLPHTVQRGDRVRAQGVSASIVLPASTVDSLRSFGVTSIKGAATKVSFKVGATKVPLTDLAIPRTKVPASGPMTLTGSGRTTAFTLGRAGVYTVFVPAKIDGTVMATTSSGSSASSPLSCSLVKGAPRAMTTVRVTK